MNRFFAYCENASDLALVTGGFVLTLGIVAYLALNQFVMDPVDGTAFGLIAATSFLLN